MNIRIKRVLGIKSSQPCVIAIVDGQYVTRWQPQDPGDGWTCTCAFDRCPHMSVVEAFIDPAVFGGE